MKSKRFKKTLRLSKETVANLSGNQLREVKGGGIYETWENSVCIPCTYPYRTCNGCVSDACTHTCDCPTGQTCITCWPEQCV